MIRLAFIAALLLVGCIAPQPKSAPSSDLPSDAPTLHIRFVRTYAAFTDDIMSRKLTVAQQLFAGVGVRLVSLGVSDIDRPDWIDIDDADLLPLRQFAGRSIQTAYLCRKITLGGNDYGGFGYPRPTNGIAIAWTSCDDVLAHELLHACGQPHTQDRTNVMYADACSAGSNISAEQAASLKQCAADKAFSSSKVIDGPPALCDPKARPGPATWNTRLDARNE